MTQMDRREFTLQSMLAMLAGATISITGCGGGGGNSGGSGNPVQPNNPPSGGGEEATISGNHGHRAIISTAELAAGAGIVLNLRFDATHNHTVALTGDEVVAIRDQFQVAKDTSPDSDGHTHVVTFNDAGPPRPGY